MLGLGLLSSIIFRNGCLFVRRKQQFQLLFFTTSARDEMDEIDLASFQGNLFKSTSPKLLWSWWIHFCSIFSRTLAKSHFSVKKSWIHSTLEVVDYSSDWDTCGVYDKKAAPFHLGVAYLWLTNGPLVFSTSSAFARLSLPPSFLCNILIVYWMLLAARWLCFGLGQLFAFPSRPSRSKPKAGLPK